MKTKTSLICRMLSLICILLNTSSVIARENDKSRTLVRSHTFSDLRSEGASSQISNDMQETKKASLKRSNTFSDLRSEQALSQATGMYEEGKKDESKSPEMKDTEAEEQPTTSSYQNLDDDSNIYDAQYNSYNNVKDDNITHQKKERSKKKKPIIMPSADDKDSKPEYGLQKRKAIASILNSRGK